MINWNISTALYTQTNYISNNVDHRSTNYVVVHSNTQNEEKVVLFGRMYSN